ncbi:GNAT family N-acetyltransferase [Paenibacillus dakarensis]|uniref:GNAT family N-acetyltransferase n=1 Tax=Paenibacillus dakarensis TaxID=1527293 RepID=UPI0006D569D9|nr:GNAT family protein [Paenibacillus dakarensis]
MDSESSNSSSFRFLTGERVYLRPIGLEDAESYYRMVLNPEVRRLTGTQQPFTLEGIRSYIESLSGDRSTILLIIALSENNEFIGDIALLDIDRTNRKASMRIAIESDKHMGKGYGSEAIRLLLEYGFGFLNLHRIELQVFGYNERAIKAYEKTGFKQEGVQRDVLFYDHCYHDAIMMSILEDEYREMYHQS